MKPRPFLNPDREIQIFQLIGKGHGTSRIAKEINLSIKTVEYYRERLKEKLGAANAEELLQMAISWNGSVS
jgi:DNA-binding CsgD family transcriptional regulator